MKSAHSDTTGPPTASPGTRQAARFECGGVRIDVRSDTPVLLHWLAEFFQGASDVDSISDYVIDFTIDAQAYTSMRADLAVGATTKVGCFTKDGGYERHVSWLRDDGLRSVHDDRARLFFRIDPRQRTASLLAESDHRYTRVTVMRIIRELVTAQGQARGDLLVHAAAITFEDCGILFAGPKGSGKTSMLFNALAHEGVGFLSNDRVIVHPGRERNQVSGQPTIVRTRPESLEFLGSPRVADWARSFHYALTPEEAESLGHELAPGDRACFSMSPAQFCRWLTVERIRNARLGGIVFPRIDSTVDTFEIERLNPDATTELLFGCLLAHGVPAAAFANPDAGSNRDESGCYGLCAQAARPIVGLECKLGPRAFRAPNVWPSIWQALSGLR